MADLDTRELVAVFAGGALGGLARAGLIEVTRPDRGGWPWATFTANVAGAFLLGYLTTRLLERLPVSGYRRPLLGTGLCGALTTFSTMQLEIVEMTQHDRLGLAVGYLGASVVTGLSAVHLATALVRRTRMR